MDDDSYVPQISQMGSMEYNLLGGGPYFDQGVTMGNTAAMSPNFQSAGQSAYAIAAPQHHGQQLYGGSSGAMMPSQPGMPPPGYGVVGGMGHEAAYRMGMAHGPFPSTPSSIAGQHQQPHSAQMLSPKGGKQRSTGGGGGQQKPKVQRRGKKEKAAEVPVDSVPIGSPIPQFAAPAQQPLPASFPNIPMGTMPSMSQQMMMHQRQMQAGGLTGAQHDPRWKFTTQQAVWGFEPQPSGGMQRPNFPSAVDAFQQQQHQLPPYYGRAMGQGASYPQLPAGHPSTSDKMDKPASYYAPQPQQQQQQQQHQPHQYQQAGVMQSGQAYPSHQDNNGTPDEAPPSEIGSTTDHISANPAYPVPSGQQQNQQWQMGHGRPAPNVSSSVGVQSPHYSQFSSAGGMNQQCHSGAMPLPSQQQQQFQQMQQQMHCELAETERQLNYFYQQPQRTPEMDSRMDQLYQHATYIRNRLVQLQKQMAQSIAAAPSYPAQQRCPPTSMSGSGSSGGSGVAAPAYPSNSVATSQPVSSSSSSALPAVSSQAALQASSMLTFANPNQSAHISPHIPQSTAQATPFYHPQMGQPSQQPPPVAPPSAAPSMPICQENAGGGRGVATKGAGPSAPVAVMQTGANQVQVNITPEAAGSRTFISVYHQYPSQMSAQAHQSQPTTSSAHSSTYPSPSLSSKADSIPPEPLPPKTQQEQYQPYGRAASVVSAASAASFSQQSVGRSEAVALPTTTRCKPSIQPLPTANPTAITEPLESGSGEDEYRLPYARRGGNLVVANQRRDELFDYPAPPTTTTEMSTSQHQQQQHRPLQKIQPVEKIADEAATAGLSSGEVQMPQPVLITAEVVPHKDEEDLHGSGASSSVLKTPEKIISPRPLPPSRETKLDDITKSPDANPAEEQGAMETIKDRNGKSAGEDMRVEGEQKQPLDWQLETALTVKLVEANTAKPEVGNGNEPATRTEGLLPEGGASSSSVSAFAQAVRDAANDIQMDDANETMGEEVYAAKEVDEYSKTADNPKAVPEPEPELATRKRGRKPSKKSTATGRTRKRKLHMDSEEEEYFDEKDVDFVVNKKAPKGGRKRKVEPNDLPSSSTTASVNASVDLEHFVEKRRSGRKRAEKKSYDEDSKVLDFEVELPLGGRPSISKDEGAGQTPTEAEPPKEEWIVEKILAMRMAKRKKMVEGFFQKKEKLKQTVAPKSSLEEEAPEEELAIRDTAREASSGESTGDGDGKVRAPKVESTTANTVNEASSCEKIDQPAGEKTPTEVGEPPTVEERSELATADEIEVPKVEVETDVKADANETADTDAKNEGEAIEESGELEAGPTAIGKPDDEAEEEWEETEEEEVYVKFKGRSYLHCAWKFVDELEELDRRVVGKINRFKLKNGKDVAPYDDEEDYFNEDYIIVDRVLDETYDETEKEHYALVKWRSLGYDECTWELFDANGVLDVPSSKIEECRKRNNVVDSCKAKERPRPRPEEWQHAKIAFDKSYKDGNRLRDYQVEGVNWLLFGYLNRQNCILADEMGLGKTVQTITFLQAVFDLGVHGPFLIVVPLSTLHNWEREFETWTHMNAIVYHGSVASRQMLQNYEFYYGQPRSEQKRRNPLVKLDVVITTFETIVNDCEVLRRINYQVCVIDEAHRLKNRNCKLLTAGLAQFQLEHRVLLTGTPLQNSIHELFSLLNFLEPEQFHNSDTFLEQFGQCQTEEQVQKLQDILKPMMLRRLKEDVEKNIPHKEETIIEVQLSNIQKKYYRAILERNFTHLLKGTSVPSLMNTMMELRKCCNHPFLIRGAEDQILAEVTSTMPMGEEKSEEDVQLHSLIQSSGKMVLIDKLLPKLRADGHKVLIFSQMVRVLDILEEFLNHRCYPYERIDGNIRGDMRQAAIDRFGKQDSERFVFLLCTRAGGLGINLTAADTVIIFDSDWNPQNDIQAQARCHRIGQTKMVKVYRLITAQTYEREMFDRASLKLGLDKAVLQSSTPRGDNNQQMSRKEVEDLLRKGAYGAVMDEDNEGSKFSEEDIETILQRRTHTIILEPGIKGSTFAKASFKSSDNREDIDILDPEFWQKWAKKANIDVDKLAGSSSSNQHQQHLIVSEPRSRRRRFEEQNYKATESGEDGIESEEEAGAGGRKPKPPKASINAGESSRGGRSAKKRRRAAGASNGAEDDDEDYVHIYRPDELSFNKAEYFRVEKLLAAWGFGRWKWVKERSDITLTEEELEHIARTLLLHCLREFRGDERTREFVWQLITPKGGMVGKVKKSAAPSSIYHEGWAASPEYNPPAFAVDSSFQRHVHRHSNKLMVRVQALEMLKQLVIGDKDKDIGELEKAHDEVQFQIPAIGDPPYKGWDMQCDKSFLMGIFKHGMDNFEAIRSDPKLCFAEKGMKEMPTVLELNNRFKRLMTVLQRQADYAANSAPIKSTKWTKTEEADFMRLLRTYGVKDSNSESVIDWARFRELSGCLKKKSDEAMLEQLYCVLAMCTHQQGGDLSAVDKRRASSVEQISAKRAEKLMNRLHLMRKIHAIITTGIHNVRTSLKLCSGDVMPDGWTDAHDEALLVVVDKFGLDHILSRISTVPQFENICDNVSDRDLLRRVIEICTTLESGKWNGKGSTEIVEDEDELDARAISALQKAAIVAAAAAMDSSGSGRSTPKAGSSKKLEALRRKGGKEPSADFAGRGAKSRHPAANSVTALEKVEKDNMRTLMQKGLLDSKMDLTNMNPSYLFSLLGMPSIPSSSSSTTQFSSSSQAQTSLQQQIQQLQTLTAMSSMFGGGSAALNNLSANALSCALGGMIQPGTSMTSKEKASSGGGVLNLTDPTKQPASTPLKAAKAPPMESSLSSGLSASAVERLNQMSAAELLALSDLPADTPIPVMHLVDGTRLTGDKAPKLKNLDEWLGANQQYTVDVMALADAYTQSTPTAPKASTSAVDSVKRDTKGDRKGSDVGGKRPTETGAEKRGEKDQSGIKSKDSSSGGEVVDAAAAACRTSAESLVQLENSVIVGVFRQSSGAVLPSDEWPKVKNLLDWLDKNPDCNIQSAYASIKTMLPKSYHSRVGGEPVGSSQQSASAISGQLDVSSLLPMADSSDLFTQLLASAMNPLGGTASSSSSSSKAEAQQQQSSTASSLPNTMEALQMQLLLQQAMLGSSLYNPYMSLLAGGSGGGLASSMLPATSNPNPGDLAAAFTSLLNSAPTSTPAPPTTSKTKSTNASASTSSARQLDALGTELAALNKSAPAAVDAMSNPALLASMLAMGNSMAALFPHGGTVESLAGIDPTMMLSGLGDASALWLAAQIPRSKAHVGDSAATTPVVENAKVVEKATLQSSRQPPKRTVGLSGKGKLNLVLEKLSSNSNPTSTPK